MTANMVGNAHLVAAGIIAVNRAQERGDSITYVAWSATVCRPEPTRPKYIVA